MPTTHPNPVRILVAEDEPEVRGYLDVALRSFGFSTELVEDGREALACLTEKTADYSLLLVDLMMPGQDGLETLRQVRQLNTELPVVMISSAPSPVNIVDAMRSGATDFLAKPITHEGLRRSIEKALGSQTPQAPRAGAWAGQTSQQTVRSGWSRKLDLFINELGSSEVPVLLLGETGVGKEVLARHIHASSPRAEKPLLKLNCAALPSELIESELFGYERGAFTGAFRTSPGKFEVADGGTILLDEIGDMDFKLQAKLLQVLQDGEFLRLGGKEICRVDVRVIAATHCDLERAVAEQRFRQDLYYRLNVIRIEIPPLRERREEVLPLAEYFVTRHSRPGEERVPIPAALRSALLDHDWPGNIRELENVIRKLVALRRPEIVIDDLRRCAGRFPVAQSRVDQSRPEPALSRVRAYSPDLPPENVGPAALRDIQDDVPNPSILRSVDEARKQAEIQAILAALESAMWNRKAAAKLLNIKYKALLYRMKRLGIGEKANTAAGS